MTYIPVIRPDIEGEVYSKPIVCVAKPAKSGIPTSEPYRASLLFIFLKMKGNSAKVATANLKTLKEMGSMKFKDNFTTGKVDPHTMAMKIRLP
jgi:hypothetical protein